VPRGQNEFGSQPADPLAELEFPRTVRFGADYWLSRCAGFRVDWPDGARGTVEEVRFGSRHDRPDVLLVRVGRLRHRHLLVPTDDVASLSPRERRICLSTDSLRIDAAP
jgi:hypothetical protein